MPAASGHLEVRLAHASDAEQHEAPIAAVAPVSANSGRP